MSSGESRTPRRKAREDEAQGTLEGLLGAKEEREQDVEEEETGEHVPTKPARGASRRARPAKGAAAAEKGEDDRLRLSLDALEESVKLLLARHADAVAGRSAAEARGRAAGSLDPVALQERVKELEAEARRLERHAAFLEDRIRGLLSRVRYVIES